MTATATRDLEKLEVQITETIDRLKGLERAGRKDTPSYTDRVRELNLLTAQRNRLEDELGM